jgi:hypothetical protein
MLIAALAAAIVRAQPAPSDAEHSRLIEGVRKQALAYDESLPNFICTQETKRSSASTKGEQKWKRLDTLTIRLSYFGRKEDYRVVQVNGKPVDKTMNKVGGSRTQGDFGSLVRGVFHQKSEGKFDWDGWSEWKGKKVAVIRYRIEREHSQFATTSSGYNHGERVMWGAEGAIYADAETHQILRLTMDSTSMPADFPVREVHISMEYATQKIGDREYLLPSQSVSETVTAKERRKSESRFTEYRKFSSESAIKFGEEKL